MKSEYLMSVAAGDISDVLVLMVENGPLKALGDASRHGLAGAEAPEPPSRLGPSDGIAIASGFRINVRWGHLDRMPRCKHGRVICSECNL